MRRACLFTGGAHPARCVSTGSTLVGAPLAGAWVARESRPMRHSRAHRKASSLLSHPGGSVWWAPRRASWWIGVLFAVGSACFLVGPFPGFVHVVGAGADAAVFFVGSLFFTTAATLQYLESVNVDRRRLRVLAFEPRRIDWWATVIQLAGTLFFNLSTFHALQTSLSTGQEDRLIWRPDAFGSICFLVASTLAWVEVCGVAIRGPRRQLEWWIVAVNLAGSVAFGVSAVAGYIVPATGDDLDLAAANVTTSVGALFFLAGAILVLIEGARARVAPGLVPVEAT